MRQKQIIKVLIIISIFNVISMSVKFLIGYYANSSAVVADAFHSMTDLLANFIGIIALKLSYKPADDDHSFGHEKIENIASLLVSIVLIYTSITVFSGAIKGFFNPSEIDISITSIILMASTLIINISVVTYERYYGIKLKSEFLIADSKHTLSDIYITIGVVISMIALKMGLPIYLDSIISVVISILIFSSGLKIFLTSTSVLIDTSIIDNNKLEEVIYSFKDVREVHYLKNRGNQVNVYVDFHIMFDKEMSVYEAHEIVEKIEEVIKNTFDYHFIFSIHIEPYIDLYKIKGK